MSAEGQVGESIFAVAARNGIQMSEDVRGTCLVQVQLPDSSAKKHLSEATLQERQILDSSQLENGYRYADTYIIDESLAGAYVFLNIYRIYYKKRSGETVELNPYQGELLISLKKRRPRDIDVGYNCGGALSCVSCHCILDVTEEEFSKIKRPICDMELDQLDWTDNVAPTSRLGCQVVIDNSIQWDKKVIRNPLWRG